MRELITYNRALLEEATDKAKVDRAKLEAISRTLTAQGDNRENAALGAINNDLNVLSAKEQVIMLKARDLDLISSIKFTDVEDSIKFNIVFSIVYAGGEEVEVALVNNITYCYSNENHSKYIIAPNAPIAGLVLNKQVNTQMTYLSKSFETRRRMK